LVLRIDGRLYRAHKALWAFAWGRWPVADLDHINGQRDDNGIDNLREATRAENNQNMRRARCDNKSGLLGVTPDRGRWRGAIQLDGRSRPLGLFDTPEAAHRAYLDAKRLLHPFGTL